MEYTPMTQTIINVTEARDNLSEILGRVKFGEEIITIEKKGKPYAVIISPEQYAAFQKDARQQVGALLQKIHARNPDVSEQELTKDVAEETEAVRKALYERGE